MPSDKKSSLQFYIDRYRSNAPLLDAPLNEAIETLLAHRSVRAFRKQAVSEDIIRQIVAAAQSAATSSNLQAWSVIAVRDEQQKARMMKLCANQKFIAEAPLFLAWCADLSRARRVAAAPLEGADYAEAFLLAVIDASLAAQNAAIAAESLGLGICYVGALRNHPEDVAKTLKLPPSVFGVFGMVVGYPDPARPASVRPRLPQEAVLHFDEYATQKEAEAVAAYNEVQQTFQKEQGMKAANWTDRVASRLKNASALDGRDTLREMLHRLGFPLR